MIMHLEHKYKDIHTLLLGDQSLSPCVNETTLENVQGYTRQTQRFCTWTTVTFWCNICDLNIEK